jgi:hypothetical protein
MDRVTRRRRIQVVLPQPRHGHGDKWFRLWVHREVLVADVPAVVWCDVTRKRVVTGVTVGHEIVEVM